MAEEAKTYRIGEVAEMLNLKTYVLRFWETEFPQLEPDRADSGQRVYTEKHVEMLRRIQKLLHEQGMTIEGARRALAGETAQEGAEQDFLGMLETELSAICQLLEQGGRP